MIEDKIVFLIRGLKTTKKLKIPLKEEKKPCEPVTRTAVKNF